MALNKILSGMVEEFKAKNSFDLKESKAYEYLVNYTLISKLHPEAFVDPRFLEVVDVDDRSTFGLDGIAFIVNDNLVLSKDDISLYAKSKNLDVKILFIQTKIETGYDTGDISKTINAAKSFLGTRILLPKDNNSIQNAYEIYEELFKYGNSKYLNSHSPECIIYYVTAGKPCVDSLVNSLCTSEQDTFTRLFPDIKSVHIHTIDADNIISSYKELENRIEVIINFKNSISFDKIDQVDQAYLGYMSANEYLNIITDSQGDLRKRLFYENVRDYQGFDNPVNSEIRSTILDSKMQDKFVLLNNGITIVTKHFKSLGANQYEMSDFNIVNGCQTSYEIYASKDKIRNVVLPLKIIHTTDPDIISKIVKATNRQTPVPDEAFIALDTYHKRLQEVFGLYSKELPVKVFYERRSGEFDLIEMPINNYQIINLHGLIRAVTCTYFQAAYMVYNNNPANILRNRSHMLFQQDHKPEIYYISNYLLALFIKMDNERRFGRASYKYRFYIPMIVKVLLSQDIQIPNLNSNKIEKDAAKIIDILKGDPKVIESNYFIAMKLLQDTISQYQKQYPHVYIDNILRDPRLNRMILANAEKYIKTSI
ncbi:AIPR family protein [Caproiciproducens sp.]